MEDPNEMQPMPGVTTPDGATGAERRHLALLPGTRGQRMDERYACLPYAVIESCHAALGSLRAASLTGIGFTSCHRGEGRTTVAVATAVIEAATLDRTTILAELDLRRPSVAEKLDLPAAPGIAEVLRGEAQLDDCVHWRDNLGVLVAGAAGDDAPKLQLRLAQGKLTKELAAMCDVVVADLPPLEERVAAVQLSRLCQCAVLVLGAGSTSVADVRRASALFEVPPPLLINRVGPSAPTWLDKLLGSD
jgi:Mrp family chromosome partitioning ATPase